jgi:hypothetical protein
MMVKINRKEVEDAVSRDIEEKKAEAIAYFQRYINMRMA